MIPDRRRSTMELHQAVVERVDAAFDYFRN
jgi:hypothetical protein